MTGDRAPLGSTSPGPVARIVVEFAGSDEVISPLG